MSLGKRVFRHCDEFGLLQVLDDGNKRYLSFGENDEQSCQLKSDPFQLQHDYSQAMLLVLLFKQPRDMILLGLGGGTLATTLHHYLPSLNIRAVELRPKVVDIARKYFQFPRNERVEVFVEDASDFLERSDIGTADVLFSDMFSDEGLDLQQTQPWFIERCAQLLNNDGWLVLNCWRQHRGEREMIDALKLHFVDVRACATVEGNWVVLAGKQTGVASSTQLKATAKKWSKVLGYSLSSSLSRLMPIN